MATETLRPNAAGDETAIATQYPAPPFHWDKVDDPSPDEDSTYVENDTAASWQRDLYNLPASSGNGTINFIKIYFRCKYEIGLAAAKPSLKSNSTVTDGTQIFLTSSWVTYSQQWNTNPADAAAWEWADIDALQIGVSLKRGSLGTYHALCTQVYVEVDYTPAVTEKTASDTGSGSDAKVSYPTATLAKSDVGSGADVKASYPSAVLAKSDLGSGVDNHIALAPQSAGDLGSGVDAHVALAPQSGGDVGGGVEASSLLAALLGADVGSGVEALGDRALGAAEVGSGLEGTPLIGLFTSDVGAGVDALIAVGLKSSDTGVGTEKFWKRPLYCIEVSWDGTGNYDGAFDDITADVKELSWERGRESELRRADVGMLELRVNNDDGKYSPPLTTGDLYGNLKPKKPIRVRAFWGEVIYQYDGFLEDIRPHPHLDEQDAYISAKDGLDFLSRADISTALFKNQLTGYLVGKISDAAGWSATKRAIDTGQDTVPYGYWHDRKALRSLGDLEESELGFIYVNNEGKLVWEDREHRHTAPHNASLATFNDIMADIRYALTPKTIYNEIIAKITPWELQVESELWRLEEEPTIDDTESKTWWANFEYFADSIVTPAASTDYQAWTGAGGTGVDKTADIVIVTTKLAKAAKLVVTNNSGGTVYLYLLKVRGEPYDDKTIVTRKAEDAQSQTDYQKRTLTLDGKYLTDAEKGQDFCDYALIKYKEPQPEVDIILTNDKPASLFRDDTKLEQILKRRISDRITAQHTLLGLDEEFYIEKVFHTIKPDGDHQCTWRVTAVGTEYHWVSPTSHDDVDTLWADETNAYDGDIGTFASGVI